MTNRHHSFDELRASYPTFEYREYNYEITDNSIKIRYNFAIPQLASFSPEWLIPIQGTRHDREILDRLIFSLGMMELVSYWKATCAKTVVIKCGAISDSEVQWWKHLYFYGLQEFFYINNISTDINNFMNIVCDAPYAPIPKYNPALSGSLIPVGGGKDSCVTLEMTSELKNRCAFIIGNRNSSIQCAKVSGIEEIVIARRTIAKELLELNSQGYLNGHTPFSGIVAFSSLLTAYLHRKRYIFLSNESSASEATVIGTDINHQYSKSFEFEQNFRQYVKDFSPVPEIEYLSLLRPLSELQIAGIFAGLESYHKIFRSCNCGSKTDSWCGKCAKCLFVFMMLSAFMEYDKVVEIFGRDMLNDTEMSEEFAQLLGMRAIKPFECVGTTHEAQQAVTMTLNRLKKNSRNIPILLNGLNFSIDKDSLIGLDTKHNVDAKNLAKLRHYAEHLGDSI